MSYKRALDLPGILWQGYPTDIDDMYHRFGNFAGDQFAEVGIHRGGPDGNTLLITLSNDPDDHIILNLGDQIVFDRSEDRESMRVGVLRAEQIGND